jgi:hypothetical protein
VDEIRVSYVTDLEPSAGGGWLKQVSALRRISGGPGARAARRVLPSFGTGQRRFAGGARVRERGANLNLLRPPQGRQVGKGLSIRG